MLMASRNWARESTQRSMRGMLAIWLGFADSRINRYLEDCFLNDPSKVMFIVDLVRPATEFLNRVNVHFVGGGVSGMNNDVILQKMVI